LSDVNKKISAAELETRFNNFLDLMTGGQDTLSFGSGLWLNMIQGKKVLSQIINSGCFRVETTGGATLSGKEKINAVIKDLLRKQDDILPDDFKKLKKVINKRLMGENE
jgi:hydroxyethylthiazole kinase-like sugar kinase family protein